METFPTESNALVDNEMHQEYFDTLMNDAETQPTKRRKKSTVWEYFTIKTVSEGIRRAFCNHCDNHYAYSIGSKVSGTSHLRRHILRSHIAKGTCPNEDPSTQITTPSQTLVNSAGPIMNKRKRRQRTPTVSYPIFDSDCYRQEMAKMVILHDYPLHMVEHFGYMSFVSNLQPNCNMVNFSTVQGDCIATFLRERHTVQNLIDQMPGHISLTLDVWNSNHTTGYVFVTGQFIDNEWNTHKKLLNVVMEPFPESDSALSHAVSSCLSDWNMEGKLFSLSFNQPVSEDGFNSLRGLLFEKRPNILNGQLLLTNCLAKSLASIAQDALNANLETVKKVRDCVKYVKMTESLEVEFVNLKQKLQVMSTKNLSLDDQTQWNTTYEMLLAASELKEVFRCLDILDPNYSKSPSDEEWTLVDNLCTCLKLLFDTANLLTSSTVSTANMFFQEAWNIQLELTRLSKSEDCSISTLTKPMQESFDKYWKSCCLILAVAVVMDPRFKMKLVEFSFSKIYGDEAASFIKIVDEGIHDLFLDYIALPPLEVVGDPKQEDGSGNEFGLMDFEVYITMESSSQQSMSELDQYLEESLLPRSHEFDVMGWWKLNKVKYPTLSKMALDILMIPVSTVSSESVFDTRVKEMDRYRCSLRPETVDALFCAKDWMNCEQVYNIDSAVKMDFPI